MTSTYSKVGTKWWANQFAFETNHLAWMNWMVMLGNQTNFWTYAWPKMVVYLQSFLHCNLALVSDLYFPKKAPKSFNKASFITVILINKVLILPDLAVNYNNKIFRLTCTTTFYTINFIWVTMFAKYLKNFSSTRKKIKIIKRLYQWNLHKTINKTFT